MTKTKTERPKIMSKKELDQELLNKLEDLTSLVELVPEIKQIVREKQEQEIFNKRAAKIGRWILIIAGGIGTVLGTMYAVAKLMVSIGR